MVTLAEIPDRCSDHASLGRLYAYIGAIGAVCTYPNNVLCVNARRSAWDSLSLHERETVTRARWLTICAVEEME